ncbi:MAG: type VI secretion system tip protein VgrG [Saprospirales bacterium]|nr:type VI secretion system tip protein VgrG [Saprospirales bacterium]
MSQSNLKIKLAGEDISAHFSDFQLSQGVNEHHFFTLRISNEDRAAHFKGSLAEVSKKWIGKLLKVEGLFDGVVTSIGMSRARTGGSDFIIRGQDPTILLDDGPNTRSFGGKPLKKILDEVMGPYESKFGEIKSNPQYTTKIKYCVQYRESNFEFINRLAARYGEWFYYDGQKLFFGKPADGKKLQLNFERDLTQLDVSLYTIPVNFKLKAYDYKNHQFPEKEANYANPENEFARIALDKSKNEVYPRKTADPIYLSMSESDLEQVVTLRQDTHLNELVLLSGTSTNPDLRPGSVVEIVDQRSGLQAGGTENYGTYILTRLNHTFMTNGEGYTNHFEAVPADTAVPPVPVSPDPPACEMQAAEVIDNDDPKSMGRVRVQFDWQKPANGDDGKTNWIRVAAPMGGGDKGFYMIPEKGDQVLVAFEQNHPERPFVLMPGMYHGKAKPEHANGNNYLKALKTKGGHQILMNDEKGKESMALSSPTDFSAAASNGEMNLTAKGKITIKSDSGEITIDTPAKIVIHAANIEINADSSIKLGAPKIEINADADLSAKAAKVSIEGQASADFKGNGMVNISSSGVTSLSGSMLKLN